MLQHTISMSRWRAALFMSAASLFPLSYASFSVTSSISLSCFNKLFFFFCKLFLSLVCSTTFSYKGLDSLMCAKEEEALLVYDSKLFRSSSCCEVLKNWTNSVPMPTFVPPAKHNHKIMLWFDALSPEGLNTDENYHFPTSVK